MPSKMRNSDLAKQVATYRVSTSFTDDAIHNILSSLNCARSLTVWLLYSNMEHGQLVELECYPSDYSEGKSFRDAYVATNLLAKAEFLKLEVSKKEAAMSKFFKFEEQCRETNSRFNNPSLDPLNKGPNAWLLNATKRKIEVLLGDYSPDEFVDEANWGPGNTTLLKGECVSSFNKFQEETGITRDLYSLVESWFPAAYPLWASQMLGRSNDTALGMSIEVGNLIVTVPKNSKTDRVIAVEPGINLWFQKAIGNMIRRRLRRNGINLNSQDLNQQFAHEAAFDDHLATVDFSSASDSISSALVRELLPPRWHTLLNSCRSVVGKNGSQIIRWQKFSSMGNGYTFELESLIFYAAALAVCEYNETSSADVSVFGDDVIIPVSCFDLYSSFCNFLGFIVNKQKSFSSGNFRESCGAHYFGDLDCKPLYLKRKLKSAQTIYKLANSVRMLAHRFRRNDGCDGRFLDTWRHLYRGLPSCLQLKCPVGIGDVGFICNFDEARPSVPGRGFEGYFVRGAFEIGINRESELPGILLARVRGSQGLAQGNSFTLRGRTRIKVSNILVSSWYNLGEWI